MPVPTMANTSRIFQGDSKFCLAIIPGNSVDLSFWSPPYHVGKSYELQWTFEAMERPRISRVIHAHSKVVKPGGFMAINIGDILCFSDAGIPKFHTQTISEVKRSSVHNGRPNTGVSKLLLLTLAPTGTN